MCCTSLYAGECTNRNSRPPSRAEPALLLLLLLLLVVAVLVEVSDAMAIVMPIRPGGGQSGFGVTIEDFIARPRALHRIRKQRLP